MRLISSALILIILAAPMAGEATALAFAASDAHAASCCCGTKSSCKCGCDQVPASAPDSKPVSIQSCRCGQPAIPTPPPTNFQANRSVHEFTVVLPFFAPIESATSLPQDIFNGSSGPPDLIASLESVILLI